MARPPCASTTPSTSAFWWGHPVFSNAAALFGHRISPEELYTCIVDMPRDGVLFIDEASAAAVGSGMGGKSGHSCPVKQLSAKQPQAELPGVVRNSAGPSDSQGIRGTRSPGRRAYLFRPAGQHPLFGTASFSSLKRCRRDTQGLGALACWQALRQRLPAAQSISRRGRPNWTPLACAWA